MTLRELKMPEDDPAILSVLAGDRDRPHWTGVRAHRRRDGSRVEVEIDAAPIIVAGRQCRLIVEHDVTARRCLEARLLQAQKMEAVGALAGGVAHDFNNMLTVILGASGSLLARTTDPDAREELHEIDVAAERSAKLVRQLLAFGRRQIMMPSVIDLNERLRALEAIYARVLGDGIALRLALEPGLGPVKADVAQLEQAITDLVVNARDAMPAGGTLTFMTATIALAAEAAAQRELAAGDYVMLSVIDTGSGIADDVRAQIFEPFFTTKRVGEGGGLGLSTVLGILRQSGGNVEVTSVAGQGTTFTMLLPRVDEPLSRAPSPSVTPSAARAVAKPTILLVDDEDRVRRLSRRILVTLGYEILEARDGREALAIVEAQGERIGLVFTDVVMPGMSGAELAEALLALRPGTKILFTSGYTEDALGEHGVSGAPAFIGKPFSPASLAAKVREVLDD
jgi:hypothetical protein